jgi:hypothetical protein
MKKIIIVSPHFPPSNLVGVHRARFLAKYLPEFNWEPIVVCVHERYYEEKLDFDLLKLTRDGTRVEKVNALGTKPVRLIGDIGLRGFFPMYFRILRLCRKEKVEVLYITIPSFWAALLGRLVHMTNGIKYGIDYQDPWVHVFPGSNKTFSRHWWSTKLARLLEPFAVKKASFITGINQAYIQGTIDRNPHLLNQCQFAEMPIGIDPDDFEKAKLIQKPAYFFHANQKYKLVYAGAILPKAFQVLEAFLEAIADQKKICDNIEIYFIGTGKTANDPEGHRVRPFAQKYGLWEDIVFEYPQRIPYLDVLLHLNASNGVLIIGSTETHYSPSKVFQAILSNKPVFAILHSLSDAANLIIETNSGMVIKFNGEERIADIKDQIGPEFLRFQKLLKSYKTSENAIQKKFQTAYQVSATLAGILEKVVR